MPVGGGGGRDEEQDAVRDGRLSKKCRLSSLPHLTSSSP